MTSEVIAPPTAGAGFPNLAVLPPRVRVIMLVTAQWLSHSINVLAEIGVADHLVDGPRTVAEIATATETDPDALYRVLRAAASLGVFAERPDGRFELTPDADCLRSDTPGSLRNFARHVGHACRLQSYASMVDTVRTGDQAFRKVHGMQSFDFYAAHPHLAEVFNGAMTAFSEAAADELSGIGDFGRFGVVADIGGGHGHMLSAVLRANSGVKGILFDRPEVLAGADPVLERNGVQDRVTRAPGDFFADVPVADAYVLKSVLHDWIDDECVTILGNIRRRIGDNADARVILFEATVPELNTFDFSKLMDIEMLVNLGGRERTEAEWRALFHSSGFELATTTRATPPNWVLEAKPR